MHVIQAQVKNINATENTEKETSEVVGQPAEEVVMDSDGEDEFETVVARNVTEAIGGDSGSDYEPKEEESDSDDSNNELSLFGDLNENNFSDEDEYDDLIIAQMFDNRKKTRTQTKKEETSVRIMT